MLFGPRCVAVRGMGAVGQLQHMFWPGRMMPERWTCWNNLNEVEMRRLNPMSSESQRAAWAAGGSPSASMMARLPMDNMISSEQSP